MSEVNEMMLSTLKEMRHYARKYGFQYRFRQATCKKLMDLDLAEVHGHDMRKRKAYRITGKGIVYLANLEPPMPEMELVAALSIGGSEQ